MHEEFRQELESFLAEDLLIGLGTIRVSLAGADGRNGLAGGDQVDGLERLQSQLARIEERANAVYSQLHRYSGVKSPQPPTLGNPAGTLSRKAYIPRGH